MTMSDARRNVIQFRVSDEERLLIEANASEHGQKLSVWVRESSLRRRPVHGGVRVEDGAVASDSVVAGAVEDLRRDIESRVGGPVRSVDATPSKRCPNGCVEGVTSPAVSKCRLCQAKLVPA